MEEGLRIGVDFVSLAVVRGSIAYGEDTVKVSYFKLGHIIDDALAEARQEGFRKALESDEVKELVYAAKIAKPVELGTALKAFDTLKAKAEKGEVVSD